MIVGRALRGFSSVGFQRPGSSDRARSCPLPRNRAKFPFMSMSKEELSKIRAQAGALGGKVVTPKKRAHLSSIASKGGKSLTPNKLKQITTAAIAGRKTITPKKVAHLSAAGAKGGKVVTEKKREHLRKALAARWAKAKKEGTS
jgi:hypothetical protein